MTLCLCRSFISTKTQVSAKQPHRIDPKTGTYKGRQVIDVKETE